LLTQCSEAIFQKLRLALCYKGTEIFVALRWFPPALAEQQIINFIKRPLNSYLIVALLNSLMASQLLSFKTRLLHDLLKDF